MKQFHNETIVDPVTDAVVEVSALVMAGVRAELRSRSDENLSFTQTRSLGYLNKRPGGSVSDVAEYLGIGIPTASKVVDELVQRNLVERRECRTDRRRVELRVTDEGVAAVREAVKPALEVVALRLKSLSEADRTDVSRVMDLLLRLMESGDEELNG